MTYLYIQEGEQTASRINSNKSTSRHVIIKLLKTKDKESQKYQREITDYL